MENNQIRKVRKLSQHYAYASLQMHETIAKSAGLSGTDHKYLGFFLEKGQMTAGELANLSGLTTGAVTGLIDRFEKKGFVKRQFVENDRRKVIIKADTEKIMALFVPLYKDFRSASEELLASFVDTEMAILETYFSKAIAIMENTTYKLSNPHEKQS
ncbi:MarR family winged helix-turn-helix transcriptional regulator [Emticicia sp. BO119]|uniref:MarR family winged helix-turn-helix transcriptional regulator n=1 Tax=Emticicia sp. BO119 TaxID=2757768 RepID=UPI0015F07082|nr:MarR family transcriptional regulator [Emticicia sp. BO119]MBA4851315.1 MarR family transcriptional regulator [Emticicia sp. BO119]